MLKKILSFAILIFSVTNSYALENGRYNIVSSLNGLYLDVAGRSTADGAKIVQYNPTGSSNQQFDVKALGDGTYSIRPAHSGKSIDVYGWNTNDGAELRQWSYSGYDNQRWRINDAGNGRHSIISVFSNKAVDVWEMSMNPGGDIRLYTWWNGPGQLWSFVPVGSVPPDGGGGCGFNPGLNSGRHSINVGGLHREYVIDIPPNYDKNKPYKLVFAWHALGGNADGIAWGGYYDLKGRANNSAIFVAPDRYVAPDGHDDSGWPNTNGRDMQFLRAMLDEFGKSLCIDKQRIFSVGWSFGGMMSLAVGREMGGIFRAVAPMSGALWTPFNDSGKPTAAWISHGIYDNFVDYNSVGIAAKDYYVAHNHCSNNTVPVNPSPCVEYQNCDAGHPVVWCPFAGPHGTPDFMAWAIWDFFSRF